MQSQYLAAIMAALDFGYARMQSVLEGMTPEQLATAPAGLKNSAAALVLHTYGTEVNFAARLTGKQVPQDVKESYLLHIPHDPLLPQPQGETAQSLTAKMEQARAGLKAAFEQLTDADLEKEYEMPNGTKRSFRALVNLLPQHQGQHFGHIQYIKQLVG
jgi:uncharacterized damage-inducible protein DinB